MKWEEQLAEAGCRITESRRAVIQVLINAEVPLSPKEILARARQAYPKLGLVTVYRTLNLVTEMSLARRVHREDGCHAYLAASPGHSHVAICERCGRAVEFPGSSDLQALIQQVEASTGYRVDAHLLQLYGLCAECQEQEGEAIEWTAT